MFFGQSEVFEQFGVAVCGGAKLIVHGEDREAAAAGESFVIARAGKPLVKVMRLEAEPPRRLGFLQGQFNVPEDFDRMAADDIQTLFEGGADA